MYNHTFPPADGGATGEARAAGLPERGGGLLGAYVEKGEMTARDRTIRTFQIRVRSEFGQNSGTFARKFKKMIKNQESSTFSKRSAKFRQNFIKI